MINSLIAGVMVSSILSGSPTTFPKTVIGYSYSQIISNESYSAYVVKSGDYLSKIAQDIYGSEDYWTNIANDNSELQNASQLEAGTILKIRDQKTDFPEVLNKELIAGFGSQPEAQSQTYTYSVANGAEVTQSEKVTPTMVPSATS